jgi:hypothetical protein
VRCLVSDPSELLDGFRQRLGVRQGGGFIAIDVEPGSYELSLEETVTRSSAAPTGGTSAQAGERRRANLAVTVNDRNIAGLALSY